jgi:ribosomal protein L12E/L44/L45/RPP1/RPP2
VLFNRVEQLNEGPMDWMKKAGDWVGKKATNLTTKITADKLNSAWQGAGAPTDSAELEKFLANQGVSDQVIKQTFQSMKIDVGAAPAEDPKKAATLYAQIKSDIQGLDKKSQKRIMAYLEKQLGTA